jgi:nucleotide sugar dehydrogenase
MKVSIIGLGSVGNAALINFGRHFPTTGYDIDGRGNWDEVIQSDVALVCVSTDAQSDGQLDMTNIYSVANRLSAVGYSGVMIVKSTLQPGTMDSIQINNPKLRVSYVPEFLREKDAVEWFGNPDRIIISANDRSIDDTLACFSWVPNIVPRIQMTHLEAEFGKLAHNTFIALKVTYTCEIERIAESRGINAAAIMEVVWRDRRINNPAHLQPGLGGFNGKCVPKDTDALAFEDSDPNSIIHQLKTRGSETEVKNRSLI